MLVCLEGIDGCGKGTQAELLAAYLNASVLKFPARQTLLGQLIYRHLETDWWAEGVNSGEEAVLFQALQVANKFELAKWLTLERARRSVVLDRYWPSAYAYGRADGLDGQWLEDLHVMLPTPDVYVLLDVDMADSLKRRPKRRDRYEKHNAKLQAAMEFYRELWAEKGWPVVDARGDVDTTQAALRKLVDTRLSPMTRFEVTAVKP